jgi:hypothetical protein
MDINLSLNSEKDKFKEKEKVRVNSWQELKKRENKLKKLTKRKMNL